MRREYRYKMDRVTYVWTVVHMLAALLFGAILYSLYDGGFLSAWFVSFVVALLALSLLSIPKKIVVDERAFTIHSLFDVTQLDVEDIVQIKKVSPRTIRWVIPLFGCSGFFGYYGYFFDFRQFHRILIYASEWRYLVEVIDIHEDYYYVSCRERDALIEQVRSNPRYRKSLSSQR